MPRQEGPPPSVRDAVDGRNPLRPLYLVVLLFDLGEGALRFLVPLLLAERGHGMAAIGLVTAVFGLATLCSRVPAGNVAARAPLRPLLLGCGALVAGAFALLPLVRGVWAAAALLAVEGLAWGVATTALLTVVLRTRPDQVPARAAIGWYVGFTGIGRGLAAAVAGVVADGLGVAGAFPVLAPLPLIAAALMSLRLPSPATGAETARQAGAARRRVWHGLSALPAAVWLAAGTALYLNVMNAVLNTFFPLLGLTLGLSLAQVGSLAGLRSTVSALARFAAVPLFRWLPPRRVQVPLLVVTAATTAIVPDLPRYAAQLPVWSGNGVSRGLLRVGTGADAMEALQPGQEGLAAGVLSAGLDAGKLIGPLLGGLIAAQVGLPMMFRVLPLAFLAVFLLASLLTRRG